jgi:cobalt-zinc-cadmium efflux system protein
VRAITLALLLLSGLFATELTIGTYSHSLSLVADAGHLLCDMAALGITLNPIFTQSLTKHVLKRSLVT